ncbi:MAG: hypothetical protein ABI432_12895 [Flavobacteriales bacterium]
MISNAAPNRPGDKVLPLLAIGLSTIALFSSFYNGNISAIIIALIGIAAGASYFLRSKWFFLLIQLWIYGQLPSISRDRETVLDDGQRITVHQPLLDAGQVFKYSIGLHLGVSKGSLDLEVNLVPLGFLILFRLLQSGALIGSIVRIAQFRRDTDLSDIFPLEGKVIRVVTLGSEKHWLLIELGQTVQISMHTIAHLLIRDKEGEIYRPGKAGRVSYLVSVPDPGVIHDGSNRKDQFKFIDWGLVSLKR